MIKDKGYLMGFSLLFFFATAFPIQRDSLENGLFIFSYEDHKLPIVEMRVIIKAGSVFDPNGKDGLANLTVKSLFRGTKRRSPLQIYEETEAVGIRMSEGVNYDYAQISASALSKDLDLVLDIVSDLLFNPVFPDSEIMKLKSEIISGIWRDESNPDYLLVREFYNLLFSRTPYEHLPVGRVESVEKLRREDVIDFYNRYYAPNNIFFVVVGDFQREELVEKIKNLFGKVLKRKIPEFQFPPPLELKGRKVKVIGREDVSQAYLMLGSLGMRETEEDVLPGRVMNFIFGGGALTSRLGKEIREKRGLAYDVGSYFDRRLFAGAFLCEMQTEIKNTQLAIDILRNEIKKMKEEGATEEEMRRAKRFYTGNFPLTFDSYGEKASLIAHIQFYGLGDDYLQRFPERIEALSLEKINEMAKRYLNSENLLLVIVGNVKEKDLDLSGWEIIKEGER